MSSKFLSNICNGDICGSILAEHQDAAADIAVADVAEEIAAQSGQDSDALLASTKKRKSFRNAAIAGGVVAGAALGLAAYGAYSIAPRKQNDQSCKLPSI